MLLDNLAKKIIEKTLRKPYDEILESSSESLDEHIETIIINKKLTVAESKSADIILPRGYVLGLISSDEIDSEIEKLLNVRSS